MKKLLASGVALAALSGAANAAPKLPMLPTIEQWIEANHQCYYGSPDRTEEETQPFCDTADALKKKLEARGYCTYGHGAVGVFSKDKKHCYAREWVKK
jgi:hypothetical protein